MRFRAFHRSLVAAIIASFLSASAIGNGASPSVQEIFDLPLSELIKISVASKRPETIKDAPSIITVISAEQIQSYGARHLRDVIDRLPNTQVIGSQLYPHNRSSVRGVTQTHLDDKILVLLNGRPLREAGQGGINGDIYSSFPVALISQIEVIRGPGSVLYGTNAFAGVINIVTKEGQESTGVTISAEAGSFGTQEYNVRGGGRQGDFNYIGAVSFHDNDGDTFTNTAAEIGPAGNFETGRHAIETVLQANYQHFSFNAIFNKVEQQSANNLLSFPSDDWTVERRFIDIGYQHTMNKHWQANASLSYNGMNNTAAIIGGTGRFFTTKSRGYLAEVSVQGELSDGSHLVVGGVYDKLKGDNVSDGTLNTEIDTWRSSLYAQLDYQTSPELKLTAGFQINKPEGGDNDISPRFAAVYKLSPAWSAKLLYGQAYRSPFGLDLFLNASFLQGNANLKPETIDTFSAQLNYQYHDNHFALAYYYSRHDDLIIRQLDNSGQARLTNSGNIEYEGVEIEYERRLSPSLSILGNASYQSNETDDGKKDSTFQPNWMLKSGLSYQKGGYNLGLFASYFGEPTQLADFNPSLNEPNPNADAYFLVTAHISADIGKLLSRQSYDGLSLSLYVDNLLDEEIYYPEISRQVINTIPSHAGRGFYCTLSYTF